MNTAAALAELGPVAAVELLYLRLLERPRFSSLRSNIVAVLQRKQSAGIETADGECTYWRPGT